MLSILLLASGMHAPCVVHRVRPLAMVEEDLMRGPPKEEEDHLYGAGDLDAAVQSILRGSPTSLQETSRKRGGGESMPNVSGDRHANVWRAVREQADAAAAASPDLLRPA